MASPFIHICSLFWAFLLNATLLYRVSRLCGLRGASSSPRIQTVSPSPPRPAPLPLSTAQMGSLVESGQTGQSHPGQSHHPLSFVTPGQSQVLSPSLSHGFCALAVSPDQPLPLFSVSPGQPTLTPVPAFCESHLRQYCPPPGALSCHRPVSNGLSKMQCDHADLLEESTVEFLFSFENSADIHGSSGLALYLCLQCDLLSATHSPLHV